MDQNDPNYTGENVETPSASPAGTTTPDAIGSVNPQSGASNLSPEEVAWNELKGGTQDRIKDILRERDEERARADRAEIVARNQSYNNQTPPNLPFNPNSPEVADAVQKLASVGIATDEKVNQLVNQRVGNLIYSFELKDLERKYDGANGLPKFERSEYEDFINKNPQYQTYSPEDVYSMKMYPEEIADARSKPRQTSRQSTTSSLRPTPTQVREESLTPEFIERRLQQSDGRKWYAENKDRINTALATAQPSSD